MNVQNLMLNQYLGLLPAQYWNRAKYPFTYVAEFLPATKAVATPAQVQISSDSDFALFFQVATFYATDNTTILAAPPFTVTIQDAGTGRFWSNAAVQVANWFGTAQLPYMHMVPVILNGGSTLTINVTNLSAATDYNVRMAFGGLKLFDMPASVAAPRARA